MLTFEIKLVKDMSWPKTHYKTKVQMKWSMKRGKFTSNELECGLTSFKDNKLMV